MDPLTWPEISRTSSRSVKLTTNGNIVYVFVCANPESPPDLHLLDLEEKSTSVDHVRDLLAESYGADRYQVEGLPIFGKAGGIITAANSHGKLCKLK